MSFYYDLIFIIKVFLIKFINNKYGNKNFFKIIKSCFFMTLKYFKIFL